MFISRYIIHYYVFQESTCKTGLTGRPFETAGFREVDFFKNDFLN